MNNELNRYYIKIRAILEIDSKIVDKQLAKATLRTNALSY